ncbi:DUF2264 domain-containing protein [Streptomyces sp. NPDC005706]|uniref:DUF2264 domain-containing protein n=1 Tax=Streptomyces sp. NPDC005706 TaxID=3157169 RepID=UPI0033D24FA7
MEGDVGTFQLAALRVADGREPDGLLESYAAGLDAGPRTPTTERDLSDDDSTSWGVITDRGQAMVGSSTIGLSLRLTHPWLWDRLDDGVREGAGRWLASALRHEPCDNNWWLLPLTVGGFLAEAGIETALAACRPGRSGWWASHGSALVAARSGGRHAVLPYRPHLLIKIRGERTAWGLDWLHNQGPEQPGPVAYVSATGAVPHAIALGRGAWLRLPPRDHTAPSHGDCLWAYLPAHPEGRVNPLLLRRALGEVIHRPEQWPSDCPVIVP